ncbi:MAG: twin-arginine translocation signal domain-containing protein [Bacteroidia bacterium]|nr:twin-arginine translocation signal domain-containing protein [Bacteroidia bacterium]
MTDNIENQKTQRRGFLGALATGAAALGLATITSPFKLNAQEPQKTVPLNAPQEPKKSVPSTPPQEGENPGDVWLRNLGGKHRVVFDATRPHELIPFAWPRVFLLTNAATGTPENDCGVIVVLRHEAIPYAFEDRIWASYKFGEMFKADDPKTKAPAVRNPFWQPMRGDFIIPGFGQVAIGINELQASGVKFCVCDAAITVYSSMAAEGDNAKLSLSMKRKWLEGLLPGIQVVPSGVWALGRAQENGFKYIFAG